MGLKDPNYQECVDSQDAAVRVIVADLKLAAPHAVRVQKWDVEGVWYSLRVFSKTPTAVETGWWFLSAQVKSTLDRMAASPDQVVLVAFVDTKMNGTGTYKYPEEVDIRRDGPYNFSIAPKSKVRNK